MKYAGMPMGMWVLFAKSFREQLCAVFGYDEKTAKETAAKAKPKYKEIIAGLPEFEKADRFKIGGIVMAAANWRTLKKLDAHIHILPDAVHTANPNSDDVWVYADLRQYVQIMRENHIERAVIMPFNDPFLMSMEFTAGAVHRNLAEMKRRYPGRFYAFADIDVRNSRAETVDALCRAIDDHALDGIKLHPNNSGLALDSDYNCAIFAFAQERHIPVAVHSYPNAEDDLSAAKRIVKTAERYPDLKLIVSHMGAFQWERLLPLACYVDLSAILPDYARRYGVEGTNALLRKFGPKRLLFATDFPASRSLRPEEIYTVYCGILDQMDFTPEEAAEIAYENAVALLG